MEAPESFRTHTLVYFQRICSKVALTKVTQEDKLHLGLLKLVIFPEIQTFQMFDLLEIQI